MTHPGRSAVHLAMRVDRQGDRQLSVSCDLLLQFGDLALGDGEDVCAGDEASGRDILVGDRQEGSRELVGVAGLPAVLS